MVKGTALSLKVDPEQDATTLKVLAGEVFFTPYLGKVGMNVGGGQASQIRGRRLPGPVQALSPAERKELLNAYRIGPDPLVALVIGGGPERVRDLLQPALLYMSFKTHPELHRFLRNLVSELNAALLEGDLSSKEGALRTLEVAVSNVADPELAIPLRLYAGACDMALGHLLRGRAQFQWVTEHHPRHPLASLALAALAETTRERLQSPQLVQRLFQQVLARYPSSPEAELAKEFLAGQSRLE